MATDRSDGAGPLTRPLQQFLSAIADAGKDLLRRARDGDGARDITALAKDLVSQKGEALGTALAREVLENYRSLDSGEKLAFFKMLRRDFDADEKAVLAAADAYRTAPSAETLSILSKVVEAPRQSFIRALNMAPGGTAAVIAMREDLLGFVRKHPDLNPVDEDFEHLLSSWFNRGFLKLRRIDWQTPAHLLEKLIEYEAVHEIHGWTDLRRRLDHDRRCFAFFHPALPDEPLIFVEVALMAQVADAVQPLIDVARAPETLDQSNTAVFYSISNCQQGLKGISFGNFLIKQVVEVLRSELPQISTFVTLSPVPGFMTWLRKQEAAKETTALLDAPAWEHNPSSTEQLKGTLPALCARYLVEAKRGDMPLDPVARFHLGNGARLERINWLGDTSPNGLAQSAGILVNYLYDLSAIEKQHEQYANEGMVAHSKAVSDLLSE